MNTIIRAKKKPSAPRRPNRSASLGIAKHPRIVANATSIVAREASCAACGPTRPAASAREVTAAGTYTVPAQSPLIDASMKSEFKIVRRRKASHGKHAAPTVVAADRVVRQCSKKNPNVVARVHEASTRATPAFWPFLRNESPTHGPLSTDSNSREKPKYRQLPKARNQRAEKREHGIPNDCKHQSANTPELVAYWPPQKGKSPANQEECEKQTAVETNVAFCRRDAGARQKFAQRRQQNQRIDERVHPVEGPAAPRGPESTDLIGGERDGIRLDCCGR